MMHHAWHVDGGGRTDGRASALAATATTRQVYIHCRLRSILCRRFSIDRPAGRSYMAAAAGTQQQLIKPHVWYGHGPWLALVAAPTQLQRSTAAGIRFEACLDACCWAGCLPSPARPARVRIDDACCIYCPPSCCYLPVSYITTRWWYVRHGAWLWQSNGDQENPLPHSRLRQPRPDLVRAKLRVV